jgi:hypothetical protein
MTNHPAAESERWVPRLVRHPNGSVSVGVTDGHVHLTITAGPGATPALLRVAFNVARQALMPGADA